MSIQETISDSKEIFHKEFPYVIPALYRKLSDELLVELHLLSHQRNFQVIPIFSLGLFEIFNVFTIGYEPEKHKELLFEALCKSNNMSSEEIKKQSLDLNEKLSSADIDNIESIIKDKCKEPVYYSRISAIGINKIIDSLKTSKDSDEEELSAQIDILSKYLGYDNYRVKKDINIYKNNIHKMNQAIEIIKENLKK